MSAAGSAPAPIAVRTRAAEVRDLASIVPADGGFCWLRHGEGLVASGEIARVPVGTGARRFEEATERLEDIFSSMEVSDEVGVPGTGPVAFGSFTFDPEVEGSVLVIPRVVAGLRGSDSWITTIGEQRSEQASPVPDVDRHDFKIRYAGSSISEVAWLEAVAKAAAVVESGDLEKVVLARDVKIWSKEPFDLSVLVRRLAARFPECFTFCCDGFVGSTPELLLRSTGSRVESLVLAGSARRGATDAEDAALGASLLQSTKDLSEHEPAVRSVVDVLIPLCSAVEVPNEPELLRLQNVQHLASPVTADLEESLSSMSLAGRLHPTAAVCGLPRNDALDYIREVEGLDRGRYAGPVGWVDANGDGEWGIGLRCAEIDGARGRLFAGAGIVGDSKPEMELEETRLKLRAMMSALESA
jgi:menaquinone-specific isochorismate synthase